MPGNEGDRAPESTQRQQRPWHDPWGLRWPQVLGLGARTLTVETDAGLAQYVEVGSGPPVVLLHGLDGSARWWLPTLEALAPHFHCYALEFVRFDRWRERSRVPLDRSSAFVAALFAALHLDRAHIVAHSMGGYSACQFAIDFPSRVDRLVLIAPAVQPRRRSPLRAAQRFLPFARTLTPAFLPILIADSVRTGPTRWLRSALELQAARPLPLEAIAAPTLLLWGEHDQLVAAKYGAQVQHRIPQARLRILPEAGHVPMYEDSAACNSAIADFLHGELIGTPGDN